MHLKKRKTYDERSSHFVQYTQSRIHKIQIFSYEFCILSAVWWNPRKRIFLQTQYCIYLFFFIFFALFLVLYF
jgi:hypothetical protein